MLSDAAHGGLDFALPGVQLMQQFVDGLPVSAVGQRLLDQSAQAAKIAFESAQFQPGFLVLQARHGVAKANPLTEGREG
ncbi:hypothetical protein LJC36_01880 [Desulfovibrio sp. OttesenSCG-928-C14]|nr:hypothetical protein [Desulfovibrio sp. OttesenSCG-928-C14]